RTFVESNVVWAHHCFRIKERSPRREFKWELHSVYTTKNSSQLTYRTCSAPADLFGQRPGVVLQRVSVFFEHFGVARQRAINYGHRLGLAASTGNGEGNIDHGTGRPWNAVD